MCQDEPLRKDAQEIQFDFITGNAKQSHPMKELENRVTSQLLDGVLNGHVQMYADSTRRRYGLQEDRLEENFRLKSNDKK